MAEKSHIRLVYSASDTPSTGPAETSSSDASVKLTTVGEELVVSKQPMEIDDLYPAHEALSPPLRAALAFLLAAGALVEQAVECLREGETIRADDAMQQLHAHLYEAFCQRELGDGYGAVVNACLSAFENNRGAALNLSQVQTISNVIAKLRNQPLLQFPEAADLIDKLDAVGLKTEAPGVPEISDWLSGETASVEGVR